MAHEVIKAVILGLICSLIFVGVDTWYDHIFYLADFKKTFLLTMFLFICKVVTYGFCIFAFLELLNIYF